MSLSETSSADQPARLLSPAAQAASRGETGPENTPAVYGASENGGYLSVTSTNA